MIANETLTFRLQFQNTCSYKLVPFLGKTMENLRNRRTIDIVQHENKLKKLTAQPTFKSLTIFNEYLVAVERYKSNIKLNRPIYIGLSVLDLSKTLMYSFHYNYIKQKYPSSQLLFTDTDSLAYTITTPDIYEDMYTDKHLFDFSGYSSSSNYYNIENKKVIGKMKDELNGIPMREFVGLRAKLYAYTYDQTEVKKCKRVSSVAVKDSIIFADYKQSLMERKITSVGYHKIQSSLHQLETVYQNKVALSFYDDKRYLLDDINSLPYGHKDLV